MIAEYRGEELDVTNDDEPRVDDNVRVTGSARAIADGILVSHAVLGLLVGYIITTL